MSYKIKGITVIDDSQNVIGAAVTATDLCTVPVGFSTIKPASPPPGSIMVNLTNRKMEYYNGSEWIVFSSVNELSFSPRGLFAGGSGTNIIDYITISSTGSATDFGDLSVTRSNLGSCGSSTRGIFGGGYTPATVNTIDFVEFSTTGNATDFGDLSVTRYDPVGCNNTTRGLFAGGYTGSASNVIDYITMASEGNATDFGDLTSVRYAIAGSSNPIRGVYAGGAGYNVTIDYVNIASTGNATSFGTMHNAYSYRASCSNPVRMVIGGGTTPNPSYSYVTIGVIDYLQIQSSGGTTTFGNLSYSRGYLAACSSPTRGVFGGGFYYAGGAAPNRTEMDYVTIDTVGNATFFGSLTVARSSFTGCSNANGGLGL